MKRFLLLFTPILLLTIIFHPKPVCLWLHTGVSCGHSGPFGWLTLQSKWRPVEVKGRLTPMLEDLTFSERFIKPEIGFDFSIALLISSLTVTVYINLKKSVRFLSNKKDLSVKGIFVLLISWIAVLSMFAIPYYLSGSTSTATTVIFKPIFGGME